MLLGSTEWAETHAADLQQHAVVYINSDGNGKGYLNASGSQTLEHFVNDVAKSITDPETGDSVWTKLAQRNESRATTPAARAAAFDGTDIHIGALGSGSDFSPFTDHLVIPTLSMSYGGEGGGGVYHSIYDDFYWYTHFADTHFVYGRALAQTYGTAIMRLADADVLPFQFTDFADTVSRYEQALQEMTAGPDGAPGFDFVPLTQAIASLRVAATEYDGAVAAAERSGSLYKKSPAELAALNQTLYQTEQKLASSAGLPKRPWYRNTITAPGYNIGYGATTLPGVSEALANHDYKLATEQQTALVTALDAFTAQVRDALKQVQAEGTTSTGNQ